MIMNNEIKRLSRNRRRIEGKFEMHGVMNLSLNKTKTEKKKNIDKNKKLEIELVKMKYANNSNNLQSGIKELNKIHNVNQKLNEIGNEILIDYTSEFEMVGKLSIGDQLRTTDIRFRKMDDFKSYINAIDKNYEYDDAIFKGYIYKTDTPQFKLVNRSQYGNGCDFKHEIIEYRGQNCFMPTKGYCFVKCVKYLTGEDHKQQHLYFIRTEKKTIKCLD